MQASHFFGRPAHLQHFRPAREPFARHRCPQARTVGGVVRSLTTRPLSSPVPPGAWIPCCRAPAAWSRSGYAVLVVYDGRTARLRKQRPRRGQHRARRLEDQPALDTPALTLLAQFPQKGRLDRGPLREGRDAIPHEPRVSTALRPSSSSAGARSVTRMVVFMNERGWGICWVCGIGAALTIAWWILGSTP